MLKRWMILLFTVVSLTASARPGTGDPTVSSGEKHPGRMIIFEDTVKWRHYIIKEHDFIHYRLPGNSKKQQGKVTAIRRDTIFMGSRYLVPGMIDKIVVGHSRYPHFHVSRSRTFAMSDYAVKSKEYMTSWKDRLLGDIRHRRVLARTDSTHSNFIKLNLSRLFGLEIAMAYERKISRSVSLEIELGYQFTTSHRRKPGSGDVFENFPFPPEGYSVYIGPKIYRIFNNPGGYVEPSFLFKDLRYLNQLFASDNKLVQPVSSEYYPVGNQFIQVYGLNLRFGMLRKYGKVIFDYYTGAGVRLKDNTYYFYGYYDYHDNHTFYYNADHSPRIVKDLTVTPAIYLGVKMGFGF